MAAGPSLTLSPPTVGQTAGFLLGSLAGQCKGPGEHHCPPPLCPRSYPPWGRGGLGCPPWLGGLDGGSPAAMEKRPPPSLLTSPPHCRGASRPRTATCVTPQPAPAATVWQPSPPRPSWVGSSCVLLDRAAGGSGQGAGLLDSVLSKHQARAGNKVVMF